MSKKRKAIVKLSDKVSSLLDFKDEIKTKFHMLNLFKGLNNAKKSRLLLLSNEKNDKIKSELKNILLANENQAA